MSSTGRNDRPRRGDGEGQVGVQEFVKCLLNQFSNVSVDRIHNLSYLIEVRHFYQSETPGNRLTAATYIRKLDGVSSKQIQTAIEDLEGVDKDTVRIGGELIPTLSITSHLEASCNGNKEIIQGTASEFGEMPPGDIDKLIRQTGIYENTSINESINFGTDTEEPRWIQSHFSSQEEI